MDSAHSTFTRYQDNDPGWHYVCQCGAEFYALNGWVAHDLWIEHSVDMESYVATTERRA